MAFTLLYGDNPFFRFAEYTFISVTIGHDIVAGIQTVILRFSPLVRGALLVDSLRLGLTFILGVMSLFILWKKYAWIASFPIAIIMGIGTGLSIRGGVMTDVVGNMRTVIGEGAKIFTASPVDGLGIVIRIVWTVSGIFYLVFTLFYKGHGNKVFVYLRTFSKYAIMSFLGLWLGNQILQVSGLISLAFRIIFRDWLGFG